MRPSELRKVERAAAKAVASLALRDEAIHEAHASGQSLRKIAEAAGLSHEQVRRILSR